MGPISCSLSGLGSGELLQLKYLDMPIPLSLFNTTQISPEHRTIPESSAPTSASDVEAAYVFVTSGALNKALGSDEVDGTRSVVLGMSMGAWSATMLCAKATHKPKAFISIYGVYSLSAIPWDKPAANKLELGPALDYLSHRFIKLIAEARAGKLPLTKGTVCGKRSYGLLPPYTDKLTRCSSQFCNFFELSGFSLDSVESLARLNDIGPDDLTAWNFHRPMTRSEQARNLMFPWSINEGVLDGMWEGPDDQTSRWDLYLRDPSPLIDADFPPTLFIHGEL